MYLIRLATSPFLALLLLCGLTAAPAAASSTVSMAYDASGAYFTFVCRTATPVTITYQVQYSTGGVTTVAGTYQATITGGSFGSRLILPESTVLQAVPANATTVTITVTGIAPVSAAPVISQPLTLSNASPVGTPATNATWNITKSGTV